MDKMSVKIPKSAIFSLIFVILATFTILLLSCTTNDLYTRILNFCKTNDKIELSDVTDFDWDIAYIDRQYYHSGEEIKGKYQINGEFQLLETDFSSRVAFCKDGKLVYDLVLNNFYLEFDPSIETIGPDSVLVVKWEEVPEQKEAKLSLLLQ